MSVTATPTGPIAMGPCPDPAGAVQGPTHSLSGPQIHSHYNSSDLPKIPVRAGQPSIKSSSGLVPVSLDNALMAAAPAPSAPHLSSSPTILQAEFSPVVILYAPGPLHTCSFCLDSPGLPGARAHSCFCVSLLRDATPVRPAPYSVHSQPHRPLSQSPFWWELKGDGARART